jgi:hypothetical protein
MFRSVFACGQQAILRDGGTHLLALTGVWSALRVGWWREHCDQAYDQKITHFRKSMN